MGDFDLGDFGIGDFDLGDFDLSPIVEGFEIIYIKRRLEWWNKIGRIRKKFSF